MGELLEGDVERVGIGPWTAKSAAEFLLTQRWGGAFNAEGQRSRGAEGKHTYRGCRIRADLLI